VTLDDVPLSVESSSYAFVSIGSSFRHPAARRCCHPRRGG